MDVPSEPDVTEPENTAPPPKPRRWRRVLRSLAIAVLIAALCVAYLLKDHIRTLHSLRRIPGTNAYVMDYYVDYNIEEIRSQGMDVKDVEDGLIRVFFPKPIAPIACWAKENFLESNVEVISPNAHHCSTAFLRTGNGDVLFGRNFDWKHNACLVVKIHGADTLASLAVIDLHYLSLDRDDLEETGLWERIPLLFAPYYLQDGMNQYGVAVSDMSVNPAEAPFDPHKPDILHSTAMRLILDYAKTTDEATALLRQYNIHFGENTGHLMIADATGKSAVVEFIDGQIVVTPTDEHWHVCTNHCIAGKTEEENDARCNRYQLASNQLAALPSAAGADDVMKIMASVAQKDWTMWTSVYNLSTGEFQLAYRQHYGEVYRDSLDMAN